MNAFVTMTDNGELKASRTVPLPPGDISVDVRVVGSATPGKVDVDIDVWPSVERGKLKLVGSDQAPALAMIASKTWPGASDLVQVFCVGIAGWNAGGASSVVSKAIWLCSMASTFMCLTRRAQRIPWQEIALVASIVGMCCSGWDVYRMITKPVEETSHHTVLVQRGSVDAGGGVVNAEDCV